MNCDLAELLGMHAGDGTLYKTSNSIVWELRGGLDEKDFYDNYIIPLLKRVYSYKFIGKLRSGGKNGCYGTRCCDKQFIKIITEEGFPIGKKSLTVEIPKSIINDSKKIQAAFLRGLLATDGCAYLTKINNKEIADYPKIEFVSASFKLIEQVEQILHNFNIKSHTWIYKPKQRGGPAKFLRINGFERCKKFVNEIGLINPKHVQKMTVLDAKQ